MAEGAPNAEVESKDLKSLISFYSNYIRNRLFGSSPSPDSGYVGKLAGFYRRRFRPRFPKRSSSLPLPLPPSSSESSQLFTEAYKVYDVLEDIMANVLSHLHEIQKHLQFWQVRAKDSDVRKTCFMIFERGPRAFVKETTHMIRYSIIDGSPVNQLVSSASVHISERMAILSRLRCLVAGFLAEVYVEVDRLGEELVKSPKKMLPTILSVVNGLFIKLEGSVQSLNLPTQNDFRAEESQLHSLAFERLPEVTDENSQWSDCEIRDATNLVYQNLHKLESYLSAIVSKYKKPRKLRQYWILYSCEAVGLAACTMWIVKHSRLMGSSDIDNWISKVKDSTVSFLKEHVEQPVLAIRDELFDTFKKRHKSVMDVEELQLTVNSLHRMLLAFCEQTKGQNLPENATDQEMLEVVVTRYEKELTHPIQNLVSGELARALLIQVQKLKLDIETAMLELDQILRANEINFAILAALPAFFLSFLLLMFFRSWLKQDTRAEGRGRIARVQRRMLIAEIDKRIMQCQTCLEQGSEADARCMYGLMLYSLDRLYHAVEKHAKATGEWQLLRQDIIDLAKPGLSTENKFRVTSRMGQLYDCLLPSPKRSR
ncbi:hypothetical protein MLD38_009515 [Melastoma candidum]|uniref:Uncharacterized protein n=1 Tax=Melastoma candidum TaxID=119954 RepID=A0ACB9RY00_9MYRT|nr:hypothetical protein MLD38_009515 [Melastoma candidum]